MYKDQPKRFHITVFSYQRKHMLKNIIKEIKAFAKTSDYVVTYKILDDGSDFHIRDENAVQFEHMGKPGFWQIWDYALRNLPPNGDIFLFIPTDVSDVDFKRIIDYSERYSRGKGYVYNVINDGRKSCWNLIRPILIDKETYRVGFTDCGFFCNRKALDSIGWSIYPVNPERFKHNPTISSGVGQQLTQRFNKAKTNIYLPVHSIAQHGMHTSLMHPEERIKNPLISK